jgi:hypothetical protein
MTTPAQSKLGFLLAATVVALTVSVRANADDVIGAAKRTEALATGKAMLSVKEGIVSPKDPFHSEAFVETLANSSGVPSSKGPADGARVQTGPRSNRDVLQAIGTSLKPRYLELGGQRILFFGQKRVKAGDMLTINFEGTDYALEIVSIEKPNFTLRLNRDEFTRPIK